MIKTFLHLFMFFVFQKKPPQILQYWASISLVYFVIYTHGEKDKETERERCEWITSSDNKFKIFIV